MFYKRKNILMLFLALVFALSPLGTGVKAQSRIIYQTVSRQIVTSGAELENIVRFTDDGWMNINVLRVDLSDKYIALDTLINTASANTLAPVKSLAEGRGAVAAINASFFNPTGNGTGYPDGPIVESEKIISAYGEYNRYGDSMASFALSSDNSPLYGYWKTDITLIAPNGETMVVNQYNKPSRMGYNDYSIFDSRWGENSIGASESQPDIVEMLVEDGEVLEIRQGKPSAQIPRNGYVVVTRQSNAGFIYNNFKKGDPVEFSITTSPDWKGIKMAVTGSSMLVVDGKIPSSFSYDIPSISKTNPRTVIGSSKDGEELFLVTVDGRQNSSTGLTQMEMAEFMKKLGAYNALNLDGGGSTTMVARKPGTDSLNIINSPSDGSARIVSTAIGVFSMAPPSRLNGLIIEAEDANVFVGTSRKFTVRGFDRYFNPVEIDPSDVKWSVSGIDGKFRGNTLYPSSVGEGKVTARVGNVSGSFNISSLSSPVELILSQKDLKLALNQSGSISITGKNKNGYGALIYPEDAQWSVKGNIGDISEGKFTAKASGTGYIDVSVGNTHAYCAVSVGSSALVTSDSFESVNGTFTSYPQTVEGSYELSYEQKHSGNMSGKLSYDFSNTEFTRAAYITFSNGGITLNPSTSKIGIWVYSTHPSTNWLRAEVYGTDGKKYPLNLAAGLDWTGWRYVEASVADQGFIPAKLTRIYLTQFHPVSDSGHIYLDDLTITASGAIPTDNIELPEDTKPVDEAYGSGVYEKTPGSFRFAVFGESREPATPLEKVLSLRLSEKINQYIEAAAFVGKGTHETSKTVEKPVVTTNIGYRSFEINDSLFLQLDTSAKGLRLSHREQWHWLLSQLDEYRGDNIFIFMPDHPDSFSDELEGKLLKDTLTNLRQTRVKNIWVFYKGTENKSQMYRGIKYIECAGFDAAGITPDNPDTAQYTLVTVKGGKVTFEFKPVI
jgi:exopolysaccharide biosynthesis protein